MRYAYAADCPDRSYADLKRSAVGNQRGAAKPDQRVGRRKRNMQEKPDPVASTALSQPGAERNKMVIVHPHEIICFRCSREPGVRIYI